MGEDAWVVGPNGTGALFQRCLTRCQWCSLLTCGIPYMRSACTWSSRDVATCQPLWICNDCFPVYSSRCFICRDPDSMVSLDREATSLAFCQRCGQLTCRDCATTNLEMDMYLCGRCVNPSIEGDSLAIALDCLFQKRFGQGLATSVTTARQAVLALFQNNNEGGRCQQIFQYWLGVCAPGQSANGCR